MKDLSWDKYFMSLCNLVSMKSKDESTNFGAVIVNDDNQIISTGYNSLPKGVCDEDPTKQLRPDKYEWMLHAEENAICNAAAIGNSTKGCRIYINGMPCARCMRKIINAGIKEVIIDYQSNEIFYRESKGDWKDLNKITLQMISESDIIVTWYEGDTINYIKRLIGGKSWS